MHRISRIWEQVLWEHWLKNQKMNSLSTTIHRVIHKKSDAKKR